MNEQPACDMEEVYESYSWCELSDNPCFKETGECDYYNELLEELEDE